MLTEDQIRSLADLFTSREKKAFDAHRDWAANIPINSAQREWDGDVSEMDDLAETSTEKAYAILEEGERGDYSRVEQAALTLLNTAGVHPDAGSGELKVLCTELMRRCILLACYENEKYRGNATGVYHKSLEEMVDRVSPEKPAQELAGRLKSPNSD